MNDVDLETLAPSSDYEELTNEESDFTEGSGQANGNDNIDEVEVTDAQQFFEHIVNLQKNEQNNARTMRRSNR